MDNRIVFEAGLLQAMDYIAEESEDNATKMLAELLKSAILNPYKDAYYQELEGGKVHKEIIKNPDDFSDVCVSFRELPSLI